MKFLSLYTVIDNIERRKGMMTPADVPVWVSIIGNFGFPIAITVYLFMRFERKLGDLEKVITNLSETIKTLTNRQ
ncbi:YvrJ family protein [Oceanobacillus sp. AG]|uniref:YvrJ family protein n=2 Tax=Oceanobacillus TaxID=182709 RepID=UPI00351A3AEC